MVDGEEEGKEERSDEYFRGRKRSSLNKLRKRRWNPVRRSYRASYSPQPTFIICLSTWIGIVCLLIKLERYCVFTH